MPLLAMAQEDNLSVQLSYLHTHLLPQQCVGIQLGVNIQLDVNLVGVELHLDVLPRYA